MDGTDKTAAGPFGAGRLRRLASPSERPADGGQIPLRRRPTKGRRGRIRFRLGSVAQRSSPDAIQNPGPPSTASVPGGHFYLRENNLGGEKTRVESKSKQFGCSCPDTRTRLFLVDVCSSTVDTENPLTLAVRPSVPARRIRTRGRPSLLGPRGVCSCGSPRARGADGLSTRRMSRRRRRASSGITKECTAGANIREKPLVSRRPYFGLWHVCRTDNATINNTGDEQRRNLLGTRTLKNWAAAPKQEEPQADSTIDRITVFFLSGH